MVHDTIPIIKTRSYLKKPQLPYIRIPGFQEIKNNDIVVFNWPADTVRQFFVKEKGVIKPRDKKSNYVKRAIGVPGDSLEIRDLSSLNETTVLYVSLHSRESTHARHRSAVLQRPQIRGG